MAKAVIGCSVAMEVRVGSQAHVFLEILRFSPASFTFVADAVYNLSQWCTNPGRQVALNFVPQCLIFLSPPVAVNFMLAVDKKNQQDVTFLYS